MTTTSHYSPPIERFLVCALYHEAKTQGVPMTVLTNRLLAEQLKDTDGWKKAQQAGHTLPLRDKLHNDARQNASGSSFPKKGDQLEPATK